jgi:16S rRNA (uracil1498-N3)-methyltransferase
MNLFFQPSLTPGSVNSLIALDAEESAHCVRVLRKRPGDEIHLTDGKGNIYLARLEDDHIKHCSIQILSVQATQRRGFRLHIAIAPTKNTDRFEWFLEKATEIGIDEITPVICEHSERTVLRTDRLQKILVAAMKQSMNLYLPQLNEPIRFSEFISKSQSGSQYIAYVEEKQELSLKSEYLPGSDALILIGPEGDFSNAEVRKALHAGYKAVSLGPSRLRTETAGIVACMTVNLANQ